jgi:hypothetical protein
MHLRYRAVNCWTHHAQLSQASQTCEGAQVTLFVPVIPVRVPYLWLTTALREAELVHIVTLSPIFHPPSPVTVTDNTFPSVVSARHQSPAPALALQPEAGSQLTATCLRPPQSLSLSLHPSLTSRCSKLVRALRSWISRWSSVCCMEGGEEGQ